MKNDYIEISGKKYRVEFNWNAITDFLELEGLSLSDVDNLKDLKPRQVTGLIFSGVVEGCYLDNIEFPYTKREFGTMINPTHVGELMLIYSRQTSASLKKEPVKEAGASQKKSLMSRLRSKDYSS